MEQYKTVIYKFIEKANQEYQQNGRSAKFVAMEDKICSVDNMLHVYYFARYVKGANIEKIQQIFCQKANLEQCFYFQKYVIGSEIKPFIQRVAVVRDYFWASKFVELATERYLEKFPKEQSPNKLGGNEFSIDKVYKYYGIEDLIHTYFPGLNVLHRYNKSGSDINHIIDLAQREYDQHGRSENFVEIENLALHALGNADGNLFIKKVKGVNIRNFERVALWRGSAFNTFMVAMHPKTNKDLMLKSLQLSKLDYIELEKELIERNRKKEDIKKAMKEAVDRREMLRLAEAYRKISDVSDYIAKIDNDYITRIEYALKQQLKAK